MAASSQVMLSGGSSDLRLRKLKWLVIGLAVRKSGEVAGLVKACEGDACVVSALNGLRDVIVECQFMLPDAEVNVGVLRMASLEYSLDFTKTRLRRNRNLDLCGDLGNSAVLI